MRLTPEEQKICDEYSKRDAFNMVHCYECPLALDVKNCACKASVTEEEYRDVKHGRWDKDSIAFYWRCSECGAIVKSNLWDVFLDPFSSHRNLNYCPNCGAQMEEVTE